MAMVFNWMEILETTGCYKPENARSQQLGAKRKAYGARGKIYAWLGS
jgi:hypothetical protein